MNATEPLSGVTGSTEFTGPESGMLTHPARARTTATTPASAARRSRDARRADLGRAGPGRAGPGRTGPGRTGAERTISVLPGSRGRAASRDQVGPRVPGAPRRAAATGRRR